MLKSEYLEKKRRWFQEKYKDTWEAEWDAWVDSNPEIPGDEPEKSYSSLNQSQVVLDADEVVAAVKTGTSKKKKPQKPKR